ncbi:hypothetical protein ACFVVX_00760 [Kitasatospora sp. NPDC058170]|uniref:hypothetical protein n=1 Tax=Kitasatospora sp. NPDC058170 TaxID=3346364 RepID=UPI0036DD5D0A
MSTAALAARPGLTARPAAAAPAGPAPLTRTERVPALAALALLPWLAVLAVCHETAWVVLDLFELAALLWLDALLRRHSAAASVPAAAIALLLAGDALADIGTAGSGLPLLAALVMALGVELPLAVLCLALARGTRPAQS